MRSDDVAMLDEIGFAACTHQAGEVKERIKSPQYSRSVFALPEPSFLLKRVEQE